jgi:hypothetical protein
MDDGVEAARFLQARNVVHEAGQHVKGIAERLASWPQLQDLVLPADEHILQAAVASCKGCSVFVCWQVAKLCSAGVCAS